jgi:light-harvesting complex I chlorophyll a/b binding protein 1
MGLAFVLSYNQMPFTRGELDEPAIDMFGAQFVKPPAAMSTSCPVGAKVPVNEMMDTLSRHGIPSSPMAKYVLTSAAAARDVSMAAQAKEEFSKLDPVTQAKFKKLAKDVVVRSASLKPEDMAGVTAPLGFFDPAGFSKSGDIAVYRTIELKHGRICMLASLGILASEKFHPFFDNWGDSAFATAATSHFSPTSQSIFWPAFWVMTATHEACTEMGVYGEETKPYDPVPWAKTRGQGDFGFDPLGLKPTDPQALKTMQTKELNNGRLAMFATLGMLAQ